MQFLMYRRPYLLLHRLLVLLWWIPWRGSYEFGLYYIVASVVLFICCDSLFLMPLLFCWIGGVQVVIYSLFPFYYVDFVLAR